MALRRSRFLFQTESPPIWTELDNPITLRIAHLIPEDAGSAVSRERFPKEIELSVENIVAKDQGCAGIVDELCSNQKGLSNSLGLWLLSIVEPNPELLPCAEKITQHRHIL